MWEIDKLLLTEIIRLKNMNKSLGQKIKHYDEMLYKKVKITAAQQSCLDFSGVVKDGEMFKHYSKELIGHLEYLREYEGRSDVFNLPRIIKLNGRKITTLRNAIKVVKEK